MTLDFRQGDARWLALRQKALGSLQWFASSVLGYGELIPIRDGPHKLLCRFVERKTGVPAIDEAKFQKVEMPRETGKTTLITQAKPIWRLCQDPEWSTLIVNEKANVAESFLGSIKKEFENNEMLRSLFPEIIPPDFQKAKWNNSEIETPRKTNRKEPSIFTTGVGGTLTGMHPDEILVDDMISKDAMENARRGAWQIMHETNRWINQLKPLVNKGAKPFPSITFIGTRWWLGDSYEHVESAFGYDERPVTYILRTTLENGEVQAIPVTVMGDLAIFRRSAIEDGRSIFPEKWDLEELAKIRVVDPSLFACNYMNNPSNEATATLKANWLKYFRWVDAEKQLEYTDGSGARHTELIASMDVVALVDPGGFSSRANEDRARAAIIIDGSKDGKHFALKMYSERDTYQVAAQQLVSFVGRFGVRKVRIESGAQQLAFIDLCKKLVRDAGYVVSWDTPTTGNKDKDGRILELEPWFESGLIYIPSGSESTEFVAQYTAFPRSKRKDMLDAMSNGVALWRRSMQRTTTNEERMAKELQAYRVRRGMIPGRR